VTRELDCFKRTSRRLMRLFDEVPSILVVERMLGRARE
jgi:hypothetical protein